MPQNSESTTLTAHKVHVRYDRTFDEHGQILGAFILRDGREAVTYRANHKDVIDAQQQPKGLQKSFVLARCLRIDDQWATLDEVLQLDNADVEALIDALFKAMR